ncbi:MAG: DNA replication/repair protein RecF [Legionellales bacterium]|nr:DNA replication/repair protein RecF [Legionellales bacterium]
MAGLNSLSISYLRNIVSAQITLHPQMNVIVGANGSGKTSLLEAIYLLGMGRSFRTRLIKQVISFEQTDLTVTGELLNATHLGIHRALTGALQIKINGTPYFSAADLATVLPVHYLNPEIYQLLDGGPSGRRQFLDWGVFHMEHEFYEQWKALNRILKQRNQALRSGCPDMEVALWDASLVACAEAIDQWRQQYVEQYKPLFVAHCRRLLQIEEISFCYQRGWPEDAGLIEVLKQQLSRDRMRGYTGRGPHRAELLWTVAGIPAKDVLSRGQQKMLLLAMKLAQEQLLQQQTMKKSLFLLDDVASELDRAHLAILLAELKGLQSQVFLTSTDQNDDLLRSHLAAHQMFHMEQGKVTAVL